jgi:hypothetical protein
MNGCFLFLWNRGVHKGRGIVGSARERTVRDACCFQTYGYPFENFRAGGSTLAYFGSRSQEDDQPVSALKDVVMISRS